MAVSNTYVVPIDFSRGSEKALDFALKLARERRGKVIALHVVPAEMIYAPIGQSFDLYSLMERDAREKTAGSCGANGCSPRTAPWRSHAGPISRQLSRARQARCARLWS